MNPWPSLYRRLSYLSLLSLPTLLFRLCLLHKKGPRCLKHDKFIFSAQPVLIMTDFRLHEILLKNIFNL